MTAFSQKSGFSGTRSLGHPLRIKERVRLSPRILGQVLEDPGFQFVEIRARLRAIVQPAHAGIVPPEKGIAPGLEYS